MQNNTPRVPPCGSAWSIVKPAAKVPRLRKQSGLQIALVFAATSLAVLTACSNPPSAHPMASGPTAVYDVINVPTIPPPGGRRATIARDVVAIPDRDTMAGRCFATGTRPSPITAALLGGAFRLDRDLVVYALPGSTDPVLVAFANGTAGAAAYVCAADLIITSGPETGPSVGIDGGPARRGGVSGRPSYAREIVTSTRA